MLEQPRGDMTGWDEYDERLAIPNNALKLSNAYIVNNQFGTPDGEVSDPDYSFDKPIRNIWQPNTNDTSRDNIENNNGYGALYSDKQLRSGLNKIAQEFDVPNRWLSDSVALMTRGTFDTNSQQGIEAQGLIAKTPRQVAELELSPYDYGTGDIETQLEAVRRQMSKTPRDILNRGAEYVLTSLIDNTVAERVAESPREALKLHNGVYTLSQLWDGLGSHQDIAYDHSLNEFRKNRMLPVHERPVSFCATCRALARSGSATIPHEGYIGD